MALENVQARSYQHSQNLIIIEIHNYNNIYKSMEDEKKRPQEETFNVGPFSLLTKSVKANNEILIALRNNKKLLGRVKAFDRHMNMVM